MYKSPIELFEKQISDMAKQIQEQKENYVYQCIKGVGINVDKEELLRALQYDRNQYNKGYVDGLKEFWETLKHYLKYKIYFRDEYEEEKFVKYGDNLVEKMTEGGNEE